MNKIVSFFATSAMAILATPLVAHGGQYRGPQDVVPPNPGGGRGTGGGGVPGPNTPSGPGPATPGAGNPVTPGIPGVGAPRATSPRAGAAGTAARGQALEDDLTRWVFWWEFNKDPFIQLKRAIRTGRTTTGSDTFYMGGNRRDIETDTLAPTREQIHRNVIPALARALAESEDREIVTASMVALAKIGEDPATLPLVPLIETQLRSHDQMVRETAALALGICGIPDALPRLTDLALDNHAGREATARGRVDERTRSFAAYGLGLLAESSSSQSLKRGVLDTLGSILANPETAGRNLKIAAITGIRLLAPGDDVSLRDAALGTLWRYYERDLGAGEVLIQAHVPSAVATLLGRGGDDVGSIRTRLIADLEGSRPRATPELAQSAALALGLLCDAAPGDASALRALETYAVHGMDQQARYFALMALGQIGGPDCRDFLLQRLSKGRTLDKPWAALALGVMTHDQRESPHGRADTTVGRALHDVLRSEKSDEVLGAVAIALGLAQYQEAAPDLRDLLTKYRRRDELAGYICVGLSLMNDQAAKPAIRDLLASSVRRPDLMKQAAIALGKLGDKEVASDLARALGAKEDRNLARMAAISAALGTIGDRHSIPPLLSMLFDTTLTDMSRAFAAVAVGSIVDRRDLPWNASIARGLNYRAAVETLTNQVSGILDIL